MKSQRSAITAQPDCREQESRRDEQSDPETWAAQISSRSELGQRIDCGMAMALKVESVGRESEEAVFHKGGEMRSAERDLFEDLDHDQRQHRPEKCRSACPA